MASLNHVNMWKNNRWVRITAKEAAMLHPGGTVSAHSGLFVCDLCGQYVTLTDGDVRTRYFKHSAYEKDKDCPERTFGPNYCPPSITAGAHDLPIRLQLSPQGFQIELGLIALPTDLLEKYTQQTFVVRPEKGNEQPFLFERISDEVTTYLSVGRKPSKLYSIVAPKEVEQYWPKVTKGISSEGSIFDGLTAKMLPEDSDVTVGKSYFLLRQGSRDYINCRGVRVTEICEQRLDWLNQWRVYKITATEFCEEAAKFFWNIHYRLTERPVRMIAVWPIHIETPELVKHDKETMLLQIKGDREVKDKYFPETSHSELLCMDGSRFVKVNCQTRQQLISVGVTKVLQYLYYWKERLVFSSTIPRPVIVDENGTELMGGTQLKLPHNGQLHVTLPFDGRMDVLVNGETIEKRLICAQKEEILINVEFGMSVRILVGLDIVWAVSYVRAVTEKSDTDEQLYRLLINQKGDEIKVSRSLGALIKRMEGYPKTIEWIRMAIQKGYASERAMKILSKHILKNRR